MAYAPVNTTDAVLSSAPCYEWRSTVDATRFTKAIAICKLADVATDQIGIRDEFAGAAQTFAWDTRILPFRTKTALTQPGTTFLFYYLY